MSVWTAAILCGTLSEVNVTVLAHGAGLLGGGLSSEGVFQMVCILPESSI